MEEEIISLLKSCGDFIFEIITLHPSILEMPDEWWFDSAHTPESESESHKNRVERDSNGTIWVGVWNDLTECEDVFIVLDEETCLSILKSRYYE